MLTIRWVHDGRVETVPAGQLPAALEVDRGFVWVDLSAPTADEQAVLDQLALGRMTREDLLEDTHLPKLDVHDDHLLLVVHAVELETSTVELATVELDIVLTGRWLLTHHARGLRAIEAVGRMLDGGGPHLDRPTVVVHRILDVMDDVFAPFLGLLGQRLELVEEDVLGSPTTATRAEIFALRRDLITLRRISVPQAEVVRQLSREHLAVVPAEDRMLFRDVYDHIHRLAEVSEAYRQLVESAHDMYRSVRDDETTRRLTVLTMVSTVLLPIGVVAGIYGMNFRHMPELDVPWAYPFVWGVFVAVLVAGVGLFRHWGWLGRRPEDEHAARRRSRVERLEVPVLDQVLRVPAYGARFAVRSGRAAAREGRRLLARPSRRRRRGGDGGLSDRS